MTFGSNISVANWEAIHRVVEEVVKHLFTDNTLQEKHRAILDKFVWCEPASDDTHFTQAKADFINKGILGEFGISVPTLHYYYVDNRVYSDANCVQRIEKEVALDVEAIYLLLGPPSPTRQNACELDHLYAMAVSFTKKI